MTSKLSCITSYERDLEKGQAMSNLIIRGNDKIDSRPFFAKVERSTKFCCFAEAKFSAWNLFELASYCKFGLSRPLFLRVLSMLHHSLILYMRVLSMS